MDFDFPTETIFPAITNILTIGGTGGLEVPIGTTAQRPVAGLVNGTFRYNTDLSIVETYSNSSWTSAVNPGTVTSISGSGGTTGLTLGGGPITGTGTLTLGGILLPANGGTGTNTSTAANGQLLIGNGTGLSLSTLTAGTAIGISNGSGSITINNTGVTSNVAGTGISVSGATGAVTISNTGVLSIAGTANQITASAATGAVTLSTPTTFIAPGSIASTSTITAGTTLTVTGNTANTFLYSGTAGLLTTTAAPTNGQLLIGSTGAAPVAATITAGSGVSVTNGAGSITITATGSGGTVTSVSTSGGTTGLTLTTTTPTTTPSITLAGTLVTANGGTGLTSIGTANQILGVNTGATALEYKTVTAGTAISITPSAGAITIANTGVTSAIGTAGNITVSAATGPVTFNLATAGTPVTNSFVKITSDTFGRVTATTAVASADITTALGYTPVNRAGDTMTGNLVMSGATTQITLPNAPLAGTDATNKNYVDAAIAGLSWKQAVRAATTVAGTLATSFANGSVIDGVTLATGDRIVIKNQVAQTENGIYIVQASGAPVRSSDANTGASLVGATVYVDQGTLNADSGWTQITNAPITIGTSNIVWSQFSGSGSYNAGTGLTLTGNTFSLTSPVSPTLGGSGTTTVPTTGQFLYSSAGTTYSPTALSSVAVTTFSAGTTGLTPNTATSGAITLAGTLAVANGGTGLTTAPTNGQIDIGSTGVGFVRTTITAGTGVSVTNGAGSITIANTGVTSLSGTANQITASAATGAVTLSTPATFIAPGSIASTSTITAGTTLTITGNTANTFLYSGTAGLVSTTAAPTNGQLLIGSTGAAPVAATLTAGTGITVTNAAGAITIAVNAAGVVTTFSGGTTGLTPNTATSGAITLAGTLALTNGGTNASLTAVNGGAVYSTGSALAITAAGTTGQYLKSNGAAAPTWVTLTNGGLQLYAENPSSPTAPSATGTNAVAIGTGSTASATQAQAFGSGTNASIYGTQAFGSGSTATAGDAQAVLAVMRNTISAAGTVELYLDGTGAAQRLVLPNNSAWTYWIDVVARRTDATGTYGSWSYQGMVYRDATAATTTVSGNSKTTIARIGNITGGSNDPTITADTTNGSLKILVTGYASNTIRYVATVRLTQVTN